MNRAGNYIFSIDDTVPGRASGWCFNERDFQPVELRCSCNGVEIFTITACASVHIDELDEDRNAGFEILIDSDIWRVMDYVNISTPDGHLIGKITQNLVMIIKEGEDYVDIDEDGRRILDSHKLSISTPRLISGEFEGIWPDASVFHYAKLFSNGVLRSYVPAERLDRPREAGPDGDLLEGFGYRFEQARHAPLLPRLVFIVIDDKFAFVASSQTVMIPNQDDSRGVLPLPFELEDVRSTNTRCDIGPLGVGLFATKHYLGSGAATLLVFQRDAPFDMTIELVDGARIEARHSGGSLVLKQVADAL